MLLKCHGGEVQLASCHSQYTSLPPVSLTSLPHEQIERILEASGRVLGLLLSVSTSGTHLRSFHCNKNAIIKKDAIFFFNLFPPQPKLLTMLPLDNKESMHSDYSYNGSPPRQYEK